MSGLLSVIEGNPRRGRRHRRKGTKKMKARRRRRHHVRAANPSHRRHRRRHRNDPGRRHRRRHHNPMLGGFVGTLMKGATVGVGVVAANAVTAAVNNFGFKGTMAGPAKIALKAGVGVGGWFALKAMKQGGLANAFLIGAGIAVTLDAYDQFVKPTVVASVPWLADYDYGSLQGYRSGTLQGWAPQAALSGWAPQAALSGDSDAYGGGAYDS